MNRFLTNKKLIVLLISVIIFIALVTLSLNSAGSNPVQGVANDFTAFVGRGFSKPTNVAMDAFDAVEDVQHTYSENQVLKREVEKVYEKDAEIASLREENDQLRSELEVGSSVNAYNTMSANVIARNPDQWVDNIIIDVGSNDGVAVNMPVMNQNGLVGITSEVNHSSSKVTLITNIDESSNQVSAQIITDGNVDPEDLEAEEADQEDQDADEEADDQDQENEEAGAVYGIISEYRPDRKELLLTQVTADVKIQEGDLVSTSGLGGLFPAGLLIGQVSEVTSDNQGLGQVVYVEPATDFNAIRVVNVVEREAETIEPDDFGESEEE